MFDQCRFSLCVSLATYRPVYKSTMYIHFITASTRPSTHVSNFFAPCVPQGSVDRNQEWFLNGGGYSRVSSLITTLDPEYEQALKYLDMMSGRDAKSHRFLVKLNFFLDSCGFDFGHLAFMRFSVIYKIWRIVQKRASSPYTRRARSSPQAPSPLPWRRQRWAPVLLPPLQGAVEIVDQNRFAVAAVAVPTNGIQCEAGPLAPYGGEENDQAFVVRHRDQASIPASQCIYGRASALDQSHYS